MERGKFNSSRSRQGCQDANLLRIDFNLYFRYICLNNNSARVSDLLLSVIVSVHAMIKVLQTLIGRSKREVVRLS